MESRIVKIRDIYKALTKGVTFRAPDSSTLEKVGYVPLLRAHNIKDMELNFDQLMFVKKQLVKQDQFLQKGDIVFVTSSGSKHLVGKSALVKDKDHDFTIGAFNSILRFSDEIDPRYIFYIFNSPLFKTYISRCLAGANINNIKKDHILDFQLPIPVKNNKFDLLEQQKIVEKLEKVLSQARQASQAIKKQRNLSSKMKSSLWHSVVDSMLELKEEQIGESLIQVAEQIEPKDAGNSIYIGLEHIASYDRSITNFGSSDQVKSSKWKFRKGDILYGKLRPYLNKCVVADRDGICSTDILVLRPKEWAIAEYIAHQIRSKDFVDFATSTMSGMNLPRTTWSKLKNYHIQIPTDSKGNPNLSKQKEIAGFLDGLFSELEKLENDLKKQENTLTVLQLAILDQEFSTVHTQENLILSPIQIGFDTLQQAIGLTLKRFPRGEMVVAKVLYLAQSIFKVPLGISFTQQAFGPYSFDIKTAVDDGLSSQKGIFVKKGTKGMEVLSLSAVGTNALNQLSGGVKKPMEDYLNVMMPLYFSSKSNSIELLATICKIIEDEKTSDDQVIYKKLQKWKPNKFGDSEIYRTISLIKKQKWDQKILQV